MADEPTSNFPFIISLFLVIAILGCFTCFFANSRRQPNQVPNPSEELPVSEIASPREIGRSLISLVASSSVMMFSVPVALLRNFEVGENTIRFLSPGSLKTNIPIKPTQDRLYFEVLLLDLPSDGCFFLGLSPAASASSSQGNTSFDFFLD